ncbi:MAG: hypothetical protein WCX82_02580 [archaeon]|jgi:predicted ribosome quality control (RQC) complex YloA/Tae2 family protein
MKKIDVTSAAFFYIVKELEDEFLNGYINNIQLVNYEENNILKFKIHKTKTKELIVTPQILFVTELIYPTNSECGGLIKFLKKKLYNQKIHEIKQDKNNRVVYFKLDIYYLIFEFFSNSNIILTDLEFNIITAKQKEEWKDRTVKKYEKYIFPQSKDIKNATEEQLLIETKDLDIKGTISYIVKEYNVSPAYIGEIKTKNEIISTIKKSYDILTPELELKANKNNSGYIILIKTGECKLNIIEFFKGISDNYSENIKQLDTKEETTKGNKQLSIRDSQLKTKENYLKIAHILEIEGQKIYEYMPIIDKLNTQITIAKDKKVPPAEIINKLNDYFSKNQKELRIKSIDSKARSYILEIKE